MNVVWPAVAYADRPPYATTAVAPDGHAPDWPDVRVLVNWQTMILADPDPTNYLLGLTGHRIGLDELRVDLVPAVDWARVARGITAEWLVAVQLFWKPELEPAIRALSTNPLVVFAPEVYCHAENGASCHASAVELLDNLKRVLGSLARTVPLLSATDSPQYRYLGVHYAACQPNPGLKSYRDRGLVQRLWHLEGVRRFGLWGLDYASAASKAEMTQAFFAGINGPLLEDLSAWL